MFLAPLSRSLSCLREKNEEPEPEPEPELLKKNEEPEPEKNLPAPQP